MSLWITLYPIAATVVAINKPLKSELIHWCVWWTVYQGIYYINYLVWWIPFIETVENIILFAMYSGMLTNYIRTNWIVPMFKSFSKYSLRIRANYLIGKKLINEVLMNITIPSVLENNEK